MYPDRRYVPARRREKAVYLHLELCGRECFLWCKGGVGVYGLPRQTFSFGSLGVRAGRSRGASWLHVAPRKCMPPTGYGYGLPVGQTNTVDRVSCGRRHVCSVFVWGLCYARTWGPTVLSRRSASSVLRGDGKT